MGKTIQFFKFPNYKICGGLGLSKTHYKFFKTHINAAINEYERALDSRAKKEALAKMQSAFAYVDTMSLPEELIGTFHQERTRFFPLMQEAYADLGISSMLETEKPDSHPI